MQIKYINTGSSPNKGDGDTLRTAFNKINANFAFISTATGLFPSALYNGTWTLALSSTGTVTLNGTPFSTGSGTANGWQLTSGTSVVSLDNSNVLSLPNGTNIYGYNIFQADAVGGFEFNSFTDHVGGGKQTWTFGTDGKLTLPAGGVITGIGPAAVEIKAPVGSQAVLINNGGYNSVVAQDQDVRIVTSPDSGTTFNTWNFATDGKLTFPDNTLQTTAYLGTATNSTLGGVIVGTNLEITPDGILTATTQSNQQLFTTSSVTFQNITLPGVGGDPHWENVTVLLHGNNFQDYSPHPQVVNETGVTIDHSIQKFGDGSYSFDNSDQINESNLVANFDRQDFTVEGWFYFNHNDIGYQPLMANAGASDLQGWNLFINTDNTLNLFASRVSGTWNYQYGTGYIPPTDIWIHIAVERHVDNVLGDTVNIYADGVKISTGSCTDWQSPTNAFYLGYYPWFPGGPRSFSGNIDEIRITLGVARYMGNNFTPPTEPYPAFGYSPNIGNIVFGDNTIQTSAWNSSTQVYASQIVGGVGNTFTVTNISYFTNDSGYLTSSTVNSYLIPGPKGDQGIQGPVGPQGSTGTQGIQGIQGIQGPIGNTGTQGIQGVQGEQGIQGIQGIQGPIGNTGTQGIQGPIGDTGAQGISLVLIGSTDTVTVETVGVGSAGQGWIGTNTGHVYFWNTLTTVWEDIGPIVGPAGPRGPQGNPGPQGEQGIAGPTGPQGTTGTQGIQGPMGPEGQQGIQGPVGPQGTTGTQGIQGPQGNIGPKGDTGDAGATGQGFNNLGAWASIVYVPYDVVTYQGSSYVCTQQTPLNTLPTNTSYWAVLAHAGAAGAKGDSGVAGADALWNYTAAYDIGSGYAVGDLATYGGQLYYRKNAHGGNTGDTPFDGSDYWDLIAAKGADGTGGGAGGPIWELTSGTSTATLTSDGNLTLPGDLLPDADKAYNLGSPTQQWKSLYVSTNTIYIDNIPLTINTSSNVLQVGTVNSTTVVNIATENFVLSQTTSTLVNGDFTVRLGTDGKLTFPTTVASPVGQTTQAFGMGNLFAWQDGEQWTIATGNPATGAFGENSIAISPGIESSGFLYLPQDAYAGVNSAIIANYATTGKVRIDAGGSSSWTFGADGTTLFPNDTLYTADRDLTIGSSGTSVVITNQVNDESSGSTNSILLGQNGITLNSINPETTNFSIFFDNTADTSTIYESVIAQGSDVYINIDPRVYGLPSTSTVFTGPVFGTVYASVGNDGRIQENFGAWSVDNRGNLVTSNVNLNRYYAGNIFGDDQPDIEHSVTAADITDNKGNSLIYVPAGDTAPDHKINGLLWFNSEEGRIYVRYNDQWVDASPTVLAPSSVYLGNITAEGDTLTINNSTLTIDDMGNLVVNGTAAGSFVYSTIQEGSVGGPGQAGVTSITGLSGTGVGLTSDAWAQLMWVPDTSAVTLAEIADGGPGYVYNWAYADHSGFKIENHDIGSSYQWSFDTDGVLNLPDDIGDIKRNGVSVLGGSGSTGPFTLTTSTEDGTSYDTIGVPSGHNIWVNADTDLVMVGGTNVRLIVDDGNNNVYISTCDEGLTGGIPSDGSYNWKFNGNDRSLTVPGNIVTNGHQITGNSGALDLNYDGAVILSGIPGVGAVIQTTTQNSSNTSTWTFGTDGTLTLPSGPVLIPSNNNLVIANNITGTNYIEITESVVQVSNNLHNWQFDSDGTFSLSDKSLILGNSSDPNVYIETVATLVTNTWTFGLNGMLSIPGAIRTSPDFKIQLGVPIDVSVPISNGGGWDVNQGTNIATTGGSGTGLTVDIVGNISGYIDSIAIHTPGSGYLDGDTITASNGGSYVTFTVTIRQTDWKFSSDGGLRFPNDNTNTQYLAYTGILNDLVDVDTATPTNGDVLQYNSALGIWQHNQLATGSITLKGTWDANTNTPTLTASQVGASAGWEYLVSAAGTQDLGLGSTAYSIGDLVLYDGTNWTVIPGSASVVSFNTRVGAIVLASLDVTTALGYTPLQSSDLSGYITLSSISTGTNATPSHNGGIAYNSSTGVFTYTPPDMTTLYNGTYTVSVNATGDLLPNTNLGQNLGSSSKQWKSLYVGTSTIYVGGTSITVNAGGSLAVGGVVSVNAFTGTTVTGTVNTATGIATLNALSLSNSGNTLRPVAVPTLLTGSAGDTVGDIANDGSYLYYCSVSSTQTNYTGYTAGGAANAHFVAVVKSTYTGPSDPVAGMIVTQRSVSHTITSVTDAGTNWQLNYLGSESASNWGPGETVTVTTAPPVGNIWKTIPWGAVTTASVQTLIANSLTSYATQVAVSTLQITVNNLTNTVSTLTTTATVQALIANSLTNYATQSYVTGRGYITTSSLSVTTGSAVSGGALAYSTTTGVFTFNPATTYTLTTATASAVGGIKVGSGLAIDGDGTLSATAQALSTATASVLGGVKIGSGITISGDGTISAAAISTASFLVNNLTAIGSTTVKDVRDTIYSIGNTSTTVTIDPTNGDIQTLTAVGNITINGFVNPVSGQTVTLIITQDGVGSRTLTSTMKFANGYSKLTTAPNAIDMMTISYIGSTYYASLVINFS